MNREDVLEKIKSTGIWDVLVIGGGASGLGVAVESASRGYATLLVEQSDFAKSTSSKSTKLVHGGVRYLAQGNLSSRKRSKYRKGIACQKCASSRKESNIYYSCLQLVEQTEIYNGTEIV